MMMLWFMLNNNAIMMMLWFMLNNNGIVIMQYYDTVICGHEHMRLSAYAAMRIQRYGHMRI